MFPSNPFFESKRHTLLINIINKLSKTVALTNKPVLPLCRIVIADMLYELKLLPSQSLDDPIFLSKETLDKFYKQDKFDILLDKYFDKWKSFDLKSELINSLNYLRTLKNIDVDVTYKIRSKKIVFKYGEHTSKIKMFDYSRLKGPNFANNLFVEATRDSFFKNEDFNLSNILSKRMKKDLIKLGVTSEFFVSSLDYYYRNHSNPFSIFNNQTSFMDQKKLTGVYLINLPFGRLYNSVLDKIISLLDTASFIFVLPADEIVISSFKFNTIKLGSKIMYIFRSEGMLKSLDNFF
jgi:hypothetical protein